MPSAVLSYNAWLCSTQTKEYLRSKSQGCAELSQAQQQVSPLQQNLPEHGEAQMDLLQQQLQEFEQVEAHFKYTNIQP